MKSLIKKDIFRAINFLLLISLSFSIAAKQFEYDVIQGKWGAYKDNWLSDDWYQYLRVNNEGGVLVYSYGGPPKLVKFRVSEIRRLPGMLMIEPLCCKELRLVVSAFRTKAGSALLTGSLFLFKEESGSEVLFNTIPLRMESLDKDVDLANKLKVTLSNNIADL